jgi:hypothetical protein
VGIVGAIWGIGGMLFLLSSAIFRLGKLTLDAFAYDLSWYHWLVLVANLIFMAYSEGYKGFQKSFSPRLAARARHLRNHPRLLHVFLAPFFCAGFFCTTRRRQLGVVILTLGIVVLILIVHRLPQPWRGIIDAGVVLGLTWGLVSVVHQVVQAFTSPDFNASPEMAVGYRP